MLYTNVDLIKSASVIKYCFIDQIKRCIVYRTNMWALKRDTGPYPGHLYIILHGIICSIQALRHNLFECLSMFEFLHVLTRFVYIMCKDNSSYTEQHSAVAGLKDTV